MTGRVRGTLTVLGECVKSTWSTITALLERKEEKSKSPTVWRPAMVNGTGTEAGAATRLTSDRNAFHTTVRTIWQLPRPIRQRPIMTTCPFWMRSIACPLSTPSTTNCNWSGLSVGPEIFWQSPSSRRPVKLRRATNRCKLFFSWATFILSWSSGLLTGQPHTSRP